MVKYQQQLSTHENVS